jgi:hypothetical protein
MSIVIGAEIFNIYKLTAVFGNRKCIGPVVQNFGFHLTMKLLLDKQKFLNNWAFIFKKKYNPVLISNA